MEDFPIVPLVAAVIIVLAIIVAVRLFFKNYIKAAPNQAAVITKATKKKSPDGKPELIIVRGGARFAMPGFTKVSYLDLKPFSISIQAGGMLTNNNVPVDIEAFGVVAFGSEEELLQVAVRKYLDFTPSDIEHQLREILLGHIRTIVGQMTVEELNSNRDRFRQQVLDIAASDFRSWGMELNSLIIQGISDRQGYIQSLGAIEIANVRRNAKIGEAEAERDARIRSAAAKQAADIAEAQADTEVAKAELVRDTERARIEALVNAERATAEQAGPKAQAIARRDVVVAEEQAEQAHQEARLETERRRAAAATETYQADTVVPAEAAKQAAILRADGDKASAIAQAEAEATARQLAGAADAEARTVAATAHQAELVAEAEGQKAKLLAEAEGQREMAAALTAYSDQAARLSVLPQLIAIMPDVVRAASEPLGNIQNLTVLDGGGNGQGGITGIMDSLPQRIVASLAALSAGGIDVSGLLGGAKGSDALVNDDVSTPRDDSRDDALSSNSQD